jgi:signal peptidase II
MDERDATVISPSRVRWEVVAGLAALVLAVDLATKRMVQDVFVIGEQRDILPFFGLQYHVNDGAAFGLLSGRQTFILAGVALALIAILVFIFLDRRLVTAIGGGLLAGGSLGNLVERVAHGRVTDFLQLPHWPTFNVADIFIVVGILVMAFTLIRDSAGAPREASPPEE